MLLLGEKEFVRVLMVLVLERDLMDSRVMKCRDGTSIATSLIRDFIRA
jgi:hypothetical protein